MSESEYKAYGEYLDTILVEGESGIIIRLKNQYAFLLYDLAGVLIVHQGFDERTLEFCGTGPYRFVTRSDDHLDLEYFADYWGEEPAIKRARYLFIPDYTDRMRALARREADIITYLPLTELDECRKAGRIVANQGVSTRYLQMDLTEFPYGNEYFRRAVNLSIDRERLCREVYQGYAVPANQFLPPGVFGFDHALGQFPYAPDSAKKLLSMLGALPVIEFDYSVARSAIADRIADDLTQVGLKLKKNALEANDYWAKVDTRQTDLVLIASIPSSYEGVGTLRSSFHTKRPEQRTGLLNRTGYSSRRLDSLIEMLTLAPDQGTATGMMIEAQKILLDDLPKIPVVWEKEIYAVSDRIDWEPRLDEMIIIKEITLRK
jgi:peptide/nickel transport system substrate-binding protein